jgi:hemerythrin superfamily protein
MGVVVSTDAIVILKDDHKHIRKLFSDFREAGPNAKKTKAKIVIKIIEALTIHTYIENECMYPDVRNLLPAVEDDVLESYEEHHVADVLCMELAAMGPDDERFDAKTTVLIENVTHHIEEEEQEWFPKLRGTFEPRTTAGNRRASFGHKEKGPQVSGAARSRQEGG